MDNVFMVPVTTRVRIHFKDRLRLLFLGRLALQQNFYCTNAPGDTEVDSQVYLVDYRGFGHLIAGGSTHEES